MRRWVPIVLVCLVVAGCGSDEPSEPATSASATDAAPAPSAVTTAAGTVDPLAITAFTCRKNAKGAWRAAGRITNGAKADRDYRVTVFIGQEEGPARSVDLENVKAGSTVPFQVETLVVAPDGPCRMQAAVLD